MRLTLAIHELGHAAVHLSKDKDERGYVMRRADGCGVYHGDGTHDRTTMAISAVTALSAGYAAELIEALPEGVPPAAVFEALSAAAPIEMRYGMKSRHAGPDDLALLEGFDLPSLRSAAELGYRVAVCVAQQEPAWKRELCAGLASGAALLLLPGDLGQLLRRCEPFLLRFGSPAHWMLSGEVQPCGPADALIAAWMPEAAAA